MNLYSNLVDVKAGLGIAGSDSDARLLLLVEAASREIDAYCGRRFFSAVDTRYFAGRRGGRDAIVDDLLSVSALHADVDADASWSEAWTEGPDFTVWPWNRWPKTRIRLQDGSSKGMVARERYLRVTGVWGHGDGASGTPWRSLGVTGTVATTTGTTMTLSADGAVAAGMTLQLGTEQVFVSAVGTLTATIQRGVNGTTAAAHAAVAVKAALYPGPIVRACQVVAAEAWNLGGREGLAELQIGDYRERYVHGALTPAAWERMLGSWKRLEWGALLD